MPINMLPDDLLRACIAALECPRSFGQVGQVCTRWHEVSRSCGHWDTYILLCKLERRIIEPTVMPQEHLGRVAAEEIGRYTDVDDFSGTCSAAVAHPAGLLYTAHDHFDEEESCRFMVHVWDLRPHVPERLHSFVPTDRDSNPSCCMHLDSGFLALACELGGRPQIRHALRPPGQPGMVLQSKLHGGLHIDEDDRSASAIHIRSSMRDVVVGYISGKVAYHDLESGICINDVHGAATIVTALASYGDQVFACGRGHDEHACATMLTTRTSELFGKRLHPWGAFMQPPDYEASKLLNFSDDTVVKALVETTVQANALLVTGQRLLVAANDVIFVWDGLTEPQETRPTHVHTLQVQHRRRGGGRAMDGASQLAVALEREQMFVAINGYDGQQPSHLGGLTCDCSVQVWTFPPSDHQCRPACLHSLTAGFAGSVTAMLLVDVRLLTWGTDRTMRVWPVSANETTSAEVVPHVLGPAPWEVGGSAQHPSVEDGGGTFDGEEPGEWEPDSDDESEESDGGDDESEEEGA